MSVRLPLGTTEFHFGYVTPTDSEPMFTALAIRALTDGWDAGEVQGVFDAWTDNFATFCPEDWAIGGGYALIGTVGDPIRIEQTSIFVSGTGSSFSVPDNCAYLIKKVGAGGGSRSRGRMFVPGVGSGLVNAGGFLLGSVAGDITAAMSAFIADVFVLHDPGDIEPVLLHGPLYTLELVDGRIVRIPVPDSEEAPTSIVNLSCAPKIATQRHRMRP